MRSFLCAYCCKAILVYFFIQAQQSSAVKPPTNNRSNDLVYVAKVTAGVYSDTRLDLLPREVASTFKSTIILTTANYAFRFHLQNFLCFTDRLGLKVMIASLDEEMNDFMRNSSYASTTYFFDINDFTWALYLNHNSSVSSAFASWNTKKYISMTNTNIGLSYELMLLGYNVLLSDPDVVMVRDPFPLMLWENMDYVHTMEVTCSVNQDWNYFHNHRSQGNTGFTLVRANTRTLHLWNQVIQAAIKDPLTNDQIHFWREIRSLPRTSVLPVGKCRNLTNQEVFLQSSNDSQPQRALSLCVLNTCQYSSCSVEFYRKVRRILNFTNAQTITLHANCLVGDERKIVELKKIGLWSATNITTGTLSSSQCLSNWTELTEEDIINRRIGMSRNRNRRVNVFQRPADAAAVEARQKTDALRQTSIAARQAEAKQASSLAAKLVNKPQVGSVHNPATAVEDSSSFAVAEPPPVAGLPTKTTFAPQLPKSYSQNNQQGQQHRTYPLLLVSPPDTISMNQPPPQYRAAPLPAANMNQPPIDPTHVYRAPVTPAAANQQTNNHNNNIENSKYAPQTFAHHDHLPPAADMKQRGNNAPPYPSQPVPGGNKHVNNHILQRQKQAFHANRIGKPAGLT